LPPRDRTQGNYNVLQNGVYTACEPCKDDPRKPPLWQVKAARIIHMRARRCFISKNASVEFFGVPLAYVPFMSTPDPTVKRKSGFLFPGLSQTSQYGFGAEHKVNLTSLTRQQAEFDASVFWRRQIRAMPATGVVYRYPFISVSSWGTHHRTDTQIVLRPNETDIAPSSIVSSLDI
jgi:hypothetical protein